MRFRILTNIGAAQLELGEKDLAAGLFLEAFPFAPTDKVAQSNRAAAYLLRGDMAAAQRCAEEALQQHPDNVMAAAYLIATLGTAAELESALSGPAKEPATASKSP